MVHDQITLSTGDFDGDRYSCCFEFEPKEHSKSLTGIASLTKDLSVATNREQVRVNISSSVRVELSLYTEEREFAPILPLLQEVADVDLEAAPQYLIGRDQERAPYQLDAGSTLHMLVGGSTGGGKSVLLHSIIWGLVFRYPPLKGQINFVRPQDGGVCALSLFAASMAASNHK